MQSFEDICSGFTNEELENLKKKFNDMDVNKDGFLDKLEFSNLYYSLLKDDCEMQTIDQDEIQVFVDTAFITLDDNNDGYISFEEFLSSQTTEYKKKNTQKKVVEKTKMEPVFGEEPPLKLNSEHDIPYFTPAPPGMSKSNIIKSTGDFKFQPSEKAGKKEFKIQKTELLKSYSEGKKNGSGVTLIAKNLKPTSKLVRRKIIPSTSTPKFLRVNQCYRWQNVVFISILGQVAAFDISNFKKASGNSSLIWMTKLYKNWIGNEMVTLFFEPELEVIYCAHSKKLFCLDAVSGTIKWVNKSLHHHHQYIVSLDEGIYAMGYKYLQLFGKTNGKLIKEIKVNVGSIFARQQSSLDVQDKYIYITNVAGIKKIERVSLNVIYDKKPGNYDITVPSLLILDDKNALLNSLGYLNLINLEDCTTIRRTKIVKQGIFYVRKGIGMMYRNKDVVFITHANTCFAIHPLTHQVYYKVKGFNSYYPVTHTKNSTIPHGMEQNSLAQDSKNVYIAGGACVKAIVPSTGVQIWTTRLPYCPKMFTMMRVNEEKKIIFVVCRGFFFGLSTINGHILFANKLKGFGRGHPCLSHLSKNGCNVDFTAQLWLQTNWVEKQSSYGTGYHHTF